MNFLSRSMKDFFKKNPICQRHFSILFWEKNTEFLNREAVRLPYTYKYNRRNFIGFVPDRKDGYKTRKEESDKEHIKYGLKQFKNELKLWTEEMKETLRADPLMICPPGLSYFIDFTVKRSHKQ